MVDGDVANLHARLERLRAETVTLLSRSRQTIAQTQDARNRDAARDRIVALREDLDAALAEVDGLRTALETRGVIEQAKGILMVLMRVDEDAAFETLVRRSQTSHRKLIEVAREVVRGAVSGDFTVPAQAGEPLSD